MIPHAHTFPRAVASTATCKIACGSPTYPPITQCVDY